MDFKVHNSGGVNRTKTFLKASATVIEAGDFIALTSGLVVKASATSAAIAYCEGGAPAWVTEIQVNVDPNLELSGTADANFAATNRGAEVDLVVSSGAQLIDIGASTTDVLKILPSADAGTVGSTTNVVVKINKPVF